MHICFYSHFFPTSYACILNTKSYESIEKAGKLQKSDGLSVFPGHFCQTILSPVSQGPSCSGDFIVSWVSLQCLTIVLLEFNCITMLQSNPVLIYLSRSEQGGQITSLFIW